MNPFYFYVLQEFLHVFIPDIECRKGDVINGRLYLSFLSWKKYYVFASGKV